MSSPVVLTPGARRGGSKEPLPDSRIEWSVLGWAGVGFLILGLTDLVLAWVPSAFGSPEWEFGTVTASFNGLPVPSLGLMIMMASGLARERRAFVRVTGGILCLLAGIVLVAGLLYATSVPVALAQVDNDVVRTGLLKAIAKTSVQGIVYAVLFLWVAVKGFKAASEW